VCLLTAELQNERCELTKGVSTATGSREVLVNIHLNDKVTANLIISVLYSCEFENYTSFQLKITMNIIYLQ